MGSFISSHNMFGNKTNNSTKVCFKCSKIIDETSYVICVRCKIHLHCECEASSGHKYYTICPSCDRCGSLGTLQGTPLKKV